MVSRRVASRRVASRRVVSCRVVLCGVCCVVGGWRWGVGGGVVWCGVVWWLEGSSTAVQILQPWCCNSRIMHLNDTISSLLLSPTELVRGPCSSFMPKHADADSARASNTLASVHLQNCWDRLHNCVPTLKIKLAKVVCCSYVAHVLDLFFSGGRRLRFDGR